MEIPDQAAPVTDGASFLPQQVIAISEGTDLVVGRVKVSSPILFQGIYVQACAGKEHQGVVDAQPGLVFDANVVVDDKVTQHTGFHLVLNHARVCRIRSNTRPRNEYRLPLFVNRHADQIAQSQVPRERSQLKFREANKRLFMSSFCPFSIRETGLLTDRKS